MSKHRKLKARIAALEARVAVLESPTWILRWESAPQKMYFPAQPSPQISRVPNIYPFTTYISTSDGGGGQ